MTKEAPPPNLRGMKKAQLLEEMHSELASLRRSLTDILDRFQTQVDGSLASLEALVQEDPPRAKVLRSLLRELRELQIKPHRGRVRDLARIQRLGETLWGLLPPED